MDDSDLKTSKTTNPREKASIISDFLFCWQLPLFAQFWSKEFTDEHIHETLEEHKSGKLCDKLQKHWRDEENQKVPSLAKAILRTFGKECFSYAVIMYILDLTATLLQPVCLKKFLQYFTPEKKVSKNQAFLFAFAIVVLYLLRVMSIHWFGLQLLTLGMKVRVACCSLIYRKFLKMKNGFVGGQMVNMMSNDVNRFNDVFYFLNYGWYSFVKLFVVMYYLDVTVGHAAIAGTVLFFGFCVFQAYVSKRISETRMQVALKTDQRIRLMNDIIYGIQIIKMYVWEKPFAKLLETARSSEIQEIQKSNLLRVNNEASRQYLTKFAVYVCILATILTKSDLPPQYFFAMVNVYDNLKTSVVGRLHRSVMHCAETKTSVDRIQKFLLSENKCDSYRQFGSRASVRLCDVDAKRSNVFVLRNVTFGGEPGELVGVTGAAGSGKSTLLGVILQEVEVTKGVVEIGGTLSYCSQEPWIFSTSIKQNILFGQKMDKRKYQKVLQICGLEHDLDFLPNGDLTLVGDRGTMLSGGQKARINLARAIYKDSDIYLLDDPLSAVDVNVAQQIFSECILSYLKDKCVILVTHQIKYLSHASKVYHVNEGCITEVLAEKIPFLKICRREEPQTRSKSNPQINVKEHRSFGFSNKNTYKEYFRSMGQFLPLFLIFGILIWIQFIQSFTDWFIAYWINQPQIIHPNNFLYIHATLILTIAVSVNLHSVIFVKFCINISQKLHNSMLNSIFSTAIKFFNNHSAGRILNRFSQDVGKIDETIPTMLNPFLFAISNVIGALIIVTMTNHWLIIPTIFLLLLFYVYSLVSIHVNINIRRTASIAQSPIYGQIIATSRGLPTIRACKCEKILEKEFDRKLDVHSSVSHLYGAMFYAFSFWVDVTCVLYTSMVIFSFLIFDIDCSTRDVGLAITQSGLLVLLVQFGMKSWTEIDAQMTSVERILEYCQLPPEVDSGTRIPKIWPKFGDIEFRSVSLQYSPERPFVLENINVYVNAGERVGIVGRTGAGKSSLITALFRLFDFEGTIYIDGVDTKTVPLSTLRSSISIIPQDPVLFLGTLRKNLDPFQEFDDCQLWSILQTVQMKKVVQNLPLGLDSPVAEGGSNFSVGEKQMLCLVRAMLRDKMIVVFDEATSCVDLENDKLIQRTIRKKIQNCTVLIIAHRLDTVLDCDKIIVMDSGTVTEFGEPSELLQNVDGCFYKLVHQS